MQPTQVKCRKQCTITPGKTYKLKIYKQKIEHTQKMKPEAAAITKLKLVIFSNVFDKVPKPNHPSTAPV